MDVAAIEPGRDFRKAIDQSVATCSVLLAVIGQEWVELKDSDGRRRLDDVNDFVRIELASALRRDIPVIPVLVRGAKMPRPEQLPHDLKELAFRNAVELTHSRWKTDLQVLIEAVRPYMEEPGARLPGAEPARAEAPKADKHPLPARAPSDDGHDDGDPDDRAAGGGPDQQSAGRIYRADCGCDCEAGGETVLVGRGALREGSERDRGRGEPGQLSAVVPVVGCRRRVLAAGDNQELSAK